LERNEIYNNADCVNHHQLGTAVFGSQNRTWLFDPAGFQNWTGVELVILVDPVLSSDRLCLVFGISDSPNAFWSVLKVKPGKPVLVRFPFSGFTENVTGEPMLPGLSRLNGTITVTDGWTSGQQMNWNVHISNIYYYRAGDEENPEDLFDRDTAIAVDWSSIDDVHVCLWSHWGTVQTNPDSGRFGPGRGDLSYHSNNMEFYILPVTQVAKNILFYITQCGHFYSRKGFHLQTPSDPMYDLLYIVEGNAVMELGGNKQAVKAGDLVLADPGRPIVLPEQSFINFYWLHFGGVLAGEFSRLLSYYRANVIVEVDFDFVKENLIDIILAQRVKQPLSEIEVSTKLYHLLCEFLKHSSAVIDGNKTIIRSAVSYIRENYRKSLTVNQIADYVSVSPFHFIRVFKKNTGYSPHEYLVLTRLNAAKFLLETTDLLIKEIALDVGFSSEARFVSAFKNDTGKTPGEFRKSQS